MLNTSLPQNVDLINLSKPRIYVVCLAAYNDGDDHGAWIEADQDANELHKEIKKILLTSPAKHPKEWAIKAYEGFFNISLSENHDLETVSSLADFLSEHGALGSALLLADYQNDDIGEKEIERSRAAIEDCYQGVHDSEEAFTRDFFSENYTIPREFDRIMPYYLNFKMLARDWFMDSFFSLEVDKKIHVFSTDY